jgi:heme-degrading monooxygenase HmoA
VAPDARARTAIIESGDRVFARVTTIEGGDPATIDESTQIARDKILPRAQQMEGWKGVLSLADRSTGEGFLITLWESEAAMNASAPPAKGLRSESSTGDEREAGVRGYEVLIFETG